MRDYSKVSPRFWTGDTGRAIRKLGAECQVIAFYLFTGPSANMLGLYYLPMPTLCHETGRPLKGALKALRSLREANFAYYDVPSEQVYLPNMAREQIGERLKRKDNRHIAVMKELYQLRKTPFFKDFVAKYRDAYELHDIVSDPVLISPSEDPSKPLRSQEQEQEQNQEQEQKGRARPGCRIPNDFELTPERAEYARSKGVDPETTFEAFCAYWRAKSSNATKLDWNLTWHSWVLKDAKDSKQRNGAGPRKTRFAQVTEGLDRAS